MILRKGTAMRRLTILLVAAAGCGAPVDDGKAMPENKMTDTHQSEPDRITLQHILISFAGTRTAATRTKAEAEKLAGDVLSRARKGEDFGALVKQLSDDPGEGVYRLRNAGAAPGAPGEYDRGNMVPAFGNVGFKLAAGEIGMAPFDPKASPYGWHIIKRLK